MMQVHWDGGIEFYTNSKAKHPMLKKMFKCMTLYKDAWPHAHTCVCKDPHCDTIKMMDVVFHAKLSSKRTFAIRV
jgi:hypothetical protein